MNTDADISLERHINELYRRLRYALLGYLVLGLFITGALIVTYVHERDINHSQRAIKRNTYQIAVVLANAEYRLCNHGDATRESLKLDNLIDCKAERESAAEIYNRLTDK